MNIPDSELQAALHEYQEWGEKMRIPAEVRIAKLLPHRREDEILEIIRICKSVQDEAYEVAMCVFKQGISQEDAVSRLHQKFPFMNNENLSRAYNQGMYYYSRDPLP